MCVTLRVKENASHGELSTCEPHSSQTKYCVHMEINEWRTLRFANADRDG